MGELIPLKLILKKLSACFMQAVFYITLLTKKRVVVSSNRNG